jgi:hypothetical protein
MAQIPKRVRADDPWHNLLITPLEEIVRHAQSLPGWWFGTHEEFARYCCAAA